MAEQTAAISSSAWKVHTPKFLYERVREECHFLKFQYSLALRPGRCADRRLEFGCFPADEKVSSQRSVSLEFGRLHELGVRLEK